MRHSSLIMACFVIAAAVLGAIAAQRAFAPAPPGLFTDLDITPPSLVFGAAYCLLCAGLLRASRGPHRGVMMLALVALLFAFVLRLVMLALDPNLFAFRALLPLPYTDLFPPLLYLSVGTVAFWAGGRSVSLLRSKEARAAGVEEPTTPRHYRPYLIVLGLAMAAITLVLYLAVGNRWTRSPLAFLIHFAPVDIMAFILMYVAIGGWQTFTRRERLAVYAFFVLVFLSGVAIGSRSAPFLPLLAWVSAVAVRGRDPRVSVRWMALGLIAFVLLLPGAMSWITIMRDLARDPAQLEVFKGLSLFQIWLRSDFSPLAVFVLLSDRLQGLDMLTIIMNQPPQEAIRAYMTPITLLKSFLVGLVPDALWRIDAPATGSLFAVGYQGYSSLSAAHHGAWTGFGFFYAYFGPAGGLVGLAALGAITTWLLGALARAPVLLSIWTSPVLVSLVFGGIVSGNFDLIAPSLFVELAALSGMIWALMRVDRGRAVTRGFANAQTEHVR